MLTVAELKRSIDLDEPKFWALIPELCETCTMPLLMSETLTGLQCSNLRCSDRIVMRVKAILDKLGVKGFGESAIEKFVLSREVVNPLEILSLSLGETIHGVSDRVSEKVILQISEEANRGRLLWEYVELAQLPGIQSKARKIFAGFETIEEAYDHIEEGGVLWVQEQLGVQSQEDYVAISAVSTFSTLMEFRDDLIEGQSWVKIAELGERIELLVVCSDQVGGGFKTKQEFYKTVDDTFPQFHITWGTSVNRKIDCLVWAGANGTPARYTSKVKTVEGYHAKGIETPILTADQFMERLANGWVQ